MPHLPPRRARVPRLESLVGFDGDPVEVSQLSRRPNPCGCDSPRESQAGGTMKKLHIPLDKRRSAIIVGGLSKTLWLGFVN